MKRSTLVLLASVSAGLVLLAGGACGGNVVLDMAMSAGSTGAGANGAGGLASTGSQGGQQNTTGTQGTGQGGTIGSGPSTVASTGTSFTTTTTTDASSSSSTGGPPVQVFCNGGQCMPGQICCFNPNGPGDHCGTEGQCDSGYVELTCDDPSQCPGGFCCAKTTPNPQTIQGISCQTTCNGPDEIIVCTNMQANVCPMGTACHHSMQLGNGYRLCF